MARLLVIEDQKKLQKSLQQGLSEEGYDPIYGARPLKRVIQHRLQNPLALKLLQGEFHEGETIEVDVDPHGQFTAARVGVRALDMCPDYSLTS